MICVLSPALLTAQCLHTYKQLEHTATGRYHYPFGTTDFCWLKYYLNWHARLQTARVLTAT